MINWSNFYIQTVADWRLCEIPDRVPDYVSFSGSAYWDLGDRVRRLSDHWGKRISTCCWYLDYRCVKSKYCLCGECFYDDFRPISNIGFNIDMDSDFWFNALLGDQSCL